MDTDLFSVVLAALTFVSALNLLLILRITRIVLPEKEEPLVPLVGQHAPPIEGVRQTDRRHIPPPEFVGRPVVLLFMSPGCPTCRSKIPELVEILPNTERAGAMLWIACSDGVHDMTALTGGTPLAARTLALDPATRKALNPLGAAPLYVFIDEQAQVQAGGYIDDEDWRAFMEQMREFQNETYERCPPTTPKEAAQL